MKKILTLFILIGQVAVVYAQDEENLLIVRAQMEQRSVVINERRNKLASVVFTVGSDLDCQFNLIQDAINTASSLNNDYELRIADNKIYTENLIIDHPDLSIKGGFANCSDAVNDISNNSQAEIDASIINLPAIILNNSDTSVKHNNDFYNLNISNGEGNQDNPAGGVNVMDDNIEVNIENSFISNNNGIDGGGIHIEGSSTIVYIKDSYLLVNNADKGGGLYCDAADVFVYGDSGITLNEAEHGGGGVHLTNACHFNFFSGTSGGVFDLRGIAANTGQYGGGINANEGALVNLWGYQLTNEIGSSDQPVNITNNKATISGGGIYVHGDETEVNAYATIINNNETLLTFSGGPASSHSGGIHVHFGSFSLSKLNFSCWDTQKCNQIRGNKVTGPLSSGAGISSYSGARIKIKDTWISDHHAAHSVFMDASRTSAHIEGNVFTNNGGDSIDGNEILLSFNDDAGSISMAYNTFVNNEIYKSLIEISQNPFFIIFGNIIKESNNVDIFGISLGGGASTNTQFQCQVAHEDQSYSGTQIVVADPDFVDEANEDFHLAPGSAAIDLCSDVYAVSTLDIDEQVRGWDDGLTDNMFGAYDAGVDEYIPTTTADISVVKDLLTPAPYVISETIQYQITVTNDGPDNATNVYVDDTPAGMTLTNVQSTNCSSLPCVIPNLNIGSSETILVLAELRDTIGDFDNSVDVASEDIDPDTSDNIDDAGNGGVTTTSHADVSVALELVAPTPYHTSQILPFHAIITNNGPDVAKNIEVSTFEGDHTQITAITSGPCVALPCNIVSLASGASIDLAMSVEIISGGSFSFFISAITDSTDDDDNNNSETFDAVAGNSADMSVSSHLVTVSDFYANSVVEIEATITNNGPEPSGSILSTVLENLQIISVTGAGCSSLPCLLGAIPNGESRTITVIASIVDSGNFSFVTNINTGNFDPNLNNNSSTVRGTALSSADVSVASNLLTHPDYYAGSILDMELVMTNNGPDETSIGITGVLDNLQLISVSGGGCNSLSCELSAMQSGESQTLSISASIISSGDFSLTSNVDSNDLFDLDLNNNGAVVGATALSSANLLTTVVVLTTGDYSTGQQIEMLVTVLNNGPDNSGEIELALAGDNINIDSVSGAGCSSVNCLLGGLDDTKSRAINVLLTITGNDTFLIGAIANGSSFDTDLENNQDVYNGTVTKIDDLIFKNSFE